MAKNTQRRIPVKWIRDRAKRAYEKQPTCYICASTQDLELHHTHSITLLLERWEKETGIELTTDELVLTHRDQFIESHHSEIYEQVYTLCNQHHIRLHSVFGKAPGLHTAAKQQHWISVQQAKHTSGNSIHTTPSYGSFFSEFTKG
jgi:5-methylcytosine-specific restriction endonuclease McrA